MNTIGIRREDKNEWERRAPITPDGVARLARMGIAVQVQPAPRRVYSDAEYAQAGATVDEDLSSCSVVLGVKEMPLSVFQEHTVYAFFSHTIKGQPYNMPMLRRMMEKRSHLIDYERIVDAKGQRLVMFGRFAGLAGMTDTLWTLGRRLAATGHRTGLLDLLPTHAYPDLYAVKAAVRAAGERIRREGWPPSLGPLVCGFAGYGNVSAGAQEIYHEFDPRAVTPEELVARGAGPLEANPFVQVVFHEKHMVTPMDPSHPFDLSEYYAHPERFRPIFDRFLPHLTVLVNAIYWDARYPRLLTLRTLQDQWKKELSGLRVIGDISCDIGGAVECTVKATDPGHPVYVYEPATNAVRDGVEGDGPAILAVDILPCELPREASENFSEKLGPYLPELAGLDVTRSFEETKLPDALRAAVVLWEGRLTPEYRFMKKFLA
jgi:saccharopine dehydrogenase (NAD+, L-lysine-forming)